MSGFFPLVCAWVRERIPALLWLRQSLGVLLALSLLTKTPHRYIRSTNFAAPLIHRKTQQLLLLSHCSEFHATLQQNIRTPVSGFTPEVLLSLGFLRQRCISNACFGKFGSLAIAVGSIVVTAWKHCRRHRRAGILPLTRKHTKGGGQLRIFGRFQCHRGIATTPLQPSNKLLS